LRLVTLIGLPSPQRQVAAISHSLLPRAWTGCRSSRRYVSGDSVLGGPALRRISGWSARLPGQFRAIGGLCPSFPRAGGHGEREGSGCLAA